MQESLLFIFFLVGQGSIESFNYALHAACSISHPQFFPMANLRDITTRNTARACINAYPGASITRVLTELNTDPIWKEWNELRNVLAHRSAPGRLIMLGGSPSSAPSVWKVAGKLQIVPSLTADLRAWLARRIEALMKTGAELMEAIIP